MKERTAACIARSLRFCINSISRNQWIFDELSFAATSLVSKNRISRTFTTTTSTEINSSLWGSNTSDLMTKKTIGKDTMQRPKVIFVLGGPGSGKGTQCSLIVEHFGFTHLSAGDLLRGEIKSGSENGRMIRDMIKEGRIVPSTVTVKLLQNAMQRSANVKFLIDGFPRNDENRTTFELETGIKPDFVLYLDCTEAEMEKRLLTRNQGRDDDNITTIRKRFNVFAQSSLSVITHYESVGKVYKIDAARPKEEVFESVKSLFLSPSEKVS